MTGRATTDLVDAVSNLTEILGTTDRAALSGAERSALQALLDDLVLTTAPTKPMIWHVHFDGDRAVALHVCDLHRAIGDSLPRCADRQPDGDCSHVQIRPCTCSVAPGCDGCEADMVA